MKVFTGIFLGSMMISSPVFAELPKEPQWVSIVECKDIKTGTVVLSEKSLSSPEFNSPTYYKTSDMNTGKTFYIFSMGADMLCTATDRDTYEKRR